MLSGEVFGMAMRDEARVLEAVVADHHRLAAEVDDLDDMRTARIVGAGVGMVAPMGGGQDRLRERVGFEGGCVV